MSNRKWYTLTRQTDGTIEVIRGGATPAQWQALVTSWAEACGVPTLLTADDTASLTDTQVATLVAGDKLPKKVVPSAKRPVAVPVADLPALKKRRTGRRQSKPSGPQPETKAATASDRNIDTILAGVELPARLSSDEEWDTDAVMALWQNEKVSCTVRLEAHQLLETLGVGSRQTVEYTLRDCLRYCADSHGGQRVRGVVRKVGLGGAYHDLDTVNAAPTALWGLCQKFGLPCPHLTRYVEQRDTVLAELTASTCTANPKKAIVQLMNGGYDWTAHGTFMCGLHRELYGVEPGQDPRPPSIASAILARTGRKALHEVTFAVESAVMYCLVDYLRTNKVQCGSLVYDGLLVRRSARLNLAALIPRAEEHLLQRFGIPFRLAEKSMELNDDDHKRMQRGDPAAYVSSKWRELSARPRQLPEEEHLNYLASSFVVIHNGGNPYYMARNRVEGTVQWKRVEVTTPAGFGPADVCHPYERQKPVPWLELVQRLAAARIIPDYERVDSMPYVDPVEDIKGQVSPGERVFNIFPGFRFAEKEMRGDIAPPSEEEQREFADVLLWHLELVICAGNAEAYAHVLRYLAHLVTRPWESPQEALVVVSKQKGLGKDALMEALRHHVPQDRYGGTDDAVQRRV